MVQPFAEATTEQVADTGAEVVDAVVGDVDGDGDLDTIGYGVDKPPTSTPAAVHHYTTPRPSRSGRMPMTRAHSGTRRLRGR